MTLETMAAIALGRVSGGHTTVQDLASALVGPTDTDMALRDAEAQFVRDVRRVVGVSSDAIIEAIMANNDDPLWGRPSSPADRRVPQACSVPSRSARALHAVFWKTLKQERRSPDNENGRQGVRFSA